MDTADIRSLFYHFCLISLFRPFVYAQPDGFAVNSQEICLQAAESIVALSESHFEVFDLHHVPPLVPYFLCDAGLLCLTLGEKGLRLEEDSPMPVTGGCWWGNGGAAEMPRMVEFEDDIDLDGEPQDTILAHCEAFLKQLQLTTLQTMVH